MGDNEQKINNNRLVANAQHTASALIKKYKRTRPTLCQFLWQLHRQARRSLRHVHFRQSSSHHASESHELFRIKCPFYDPRPSSHIASPLSLSLSFTTLFGLIAPQRAIKHRERACTTPSLPNPDRTKRDTLYGRQKENLIVRRRVFSEKGV